MNPAEAALAQLEVLLDEQEAAAALASGKTLASSPCVPVQPDEWARGEREGYGGPRDVTSLSLSKQTRRLRAPPTRP